MWHVSRKWRIRPTKWDKGKNYCNYRATLFVYSAPAKTTNNKNISAAQILRHDDIPVFPEQLPRKKKKKKKRKKRSGMTLAGQDVLYRLDIGCHQVAFPARFAFLYCFVSFYNVLLSRWTFDFWLVSRESIQHGSPLPSPQSMYLPQPHRPYGPQSVLFTPYNTRFWFTFQKFLWSTYRYVCSDFEWKTFTYFRMCAYVDVNILCGVLSRLWSFISGIFPLKRIFLRRVIRNRLIYT